MTKGSGNKPQTALIILFALTCGVLYALLLPLWEGFDESFHYSYVQELSVHHRFPVLGQSALSKEIWDSLHLVPVSHVVQTALPMLTPFSA